MDEELKKRIALFRFRVIADLADTGKLGCGELSRLVEEKSCMAYTIPGSMATSVSKSTIYRWLTLYRASGNRLESLYPKERSDKHKLKSLDPDTVQAIIRLRRNLIKHSVPDFISEARQRNVLPPDVKVSRATLYRLFRQEGLYKDRSHTPVDRRKYEAELPMELWQADVMHGPRVLVGSKLRKSYLLAFIDDHSRFITHAEFYLAENSVSFKHGFKQAVVRRGLPRKLYVDNGPLFRNTEIRYIMASLGVVLIHATPYEPQGKGKIERWFRTVRSQFLKHCASGLTLDELNMALDTYLRDVYHVRRHSSTGMTPIKRYTDHIHAIRSAPDDIDAYFRIQKERKVRKDRTISLDGYQYEAPVELIGKRVKLLYLDSDTSKIEVQYQGKSFGFLIPLDIHINARVRRNRNTVRHSETDSSHDPASEDDSEQTGLLFGGWTSSHEEDHDERS